jgi:hypothetical protein
MSFIEKVIETTSNMIAQLIASFIVIFIWMVIVVLAILGILIIK